MVRNRNVAKTLIALSMLLAVGRTAVFAEDSLAVQVDRAFHSYNTKHFDEAKSAFESALKVAKQNGDKDPNIGTCYNGLALIAESQSKNDEAADLFRKALSSKEAAVGVDDPALFNIIMNLAKFDLSTAKNDDAEALFKRAIAITEKAKGPDDKDIALASNSLAMLYQREKKYHEAGKCVESSIKSNREKRRT